MDKTTILENLINYYTNGNKAKFAAMVGVSPQLISTWLARNTFNAEQIYTKCEGINAAWLLTGEGEMFAKDAAPVRNSAYVRGNHYHVEQEKTVPAPSRISAKQEIELATLRERVAGQEQLIATLREAIAAHRQTIAQQQQAIALLRERKTN